MEKNPNSQSRKNWCFSCPCHRCINLSSFRLIVKEIFIPSFSVLIVSFQCMYVMCSTSVLSEGKIRIVFSDSNFKDFISVRLIWHAGSMLWLSLTSSLHLGESISPHTKKYFGKSISFHYMLQLFSVLYLCKFYSLMSIPF